MVTALLVVGCDKEDVTFSQHEQIVKYLTSTLGLVSEQDLGSVVEEQPRFYSTFDRYAYRYILNYYDEGREALPQVEWGSVVELRFDAYIINNGSPTTIYWSNTPATYETFKEQNPNFTLDWSTEPFRVRVGDDDMLEGLALALPGCREKDSVQVFMTYNLAYGRKNFGQVPKKSAVAWYMKIEKVDE